MDVPSVQILNIKNTHPALKWLPCVFRVGALVPLMKENRSGTIISTPKSYFSIRMKDHKHCHNLRKPFEIGRLFCLCIYLDYSSSGTISINHVAPQHLFANEPQTLNK